MAVSARRQYYVSTLSWAIASGGNTLPRDILSVLSLQHTTTLATTFSWRLSKEAIAHELEEATCSISS